MFSSFTFAFFSLTPILSFAACLSLCHHQHYGHHCVHHAACVFSARITGHLCDSFIKAPPALGRLTGHIRRGSTSVSLSPS
ncbi:hypothetical protein PF008_g9788 [Phytophthora fragariae]|uniref:Secreted protein n=1 Tax=Phytophthora fragariae TaxID=53985 RepID=A0A6G0RW75_9STRA|nr:hypothetical protein PF008_g9788 [Phytophthora fragariae]